MVQEEREMLGRYIVQEEREMLGRYIGEGFCSVYTHTSKYKLNIPQPW